MLVMIWIRLAGGEKGLPLIEAASFLDLDPDPRHCLDAFLVLGVAGSCQSSRINRPRLSRYRGCQLGNSGSPSSRASSFREAETLPVSERYIWAIDLAQHGILYGGTETPVSDAVLCSPSVDGSRNPHGGSALGGTVQWLRRPPWVARRPIKATSLINWT